MPKIVRGTETDKWLPKNWRKCTFPILRQPAKTSDDIAGSAFLLHYKKIPYIVTASHVIEMENPVIAFSKKDRQVICVSSSAFQQAGLKWIKHPAGFDLAAIPFHLPLSFVKELDVLSITEDKWTLQTKIKVGAEVAHLGLSRERYFNLSRRVTLHISTGNAGKNHSTESVWYYHEDCRCSWCERRTSFSKKRE